MPIIYKIDVLASLKEKGYNTTRLRKEKLLAELEQYYPKTKQEEYSVLGIRFELITK